MILVIIIIIIIICCISSGIFMYVVLKDNTLYIENVQLMGNDISKTDNVLTIQDCKKLCIDNVQCQSFDYNTGSKQCFLKGSKKVTGTSKAVTAYKLKNNNFTVYDGYSIDDIGTANLPEMPINNMTQEECQTKCKNSEDCKLYRYTYGPGTKSCALKFYRTNELYTHGNLERKDLKNISVDPISTNPV